MTKFIYQVFKHSSQYLDEYVTLITSQNEHSAQNEKHHIFPKSIWPQYDRKELLVSLTPIDHYHAHVLLLKHFESVNDTDSALRCKYALKRMNAYSKYGDQRITIGKLPKIKSKKIDIVAPCGRYATNRFCTVNSIAKKNCNQLHICPKYLSHGPMV